MTPSRKPLAGPASRAALGRFMTSCCCRELVRPQHASSMRLVSASFYATGLDYHQRKPSSQRMSERNPHNNCATAAMHPPPLLSSLMAIAILTFSCAASPGLVSTSLNSTNAQEFYCLKQKDWTKPHWPATAYDNLYSISVRLREGYWRPNQGQEFEFLPNGEVPVTGLPLVRTPFKIKLGTHSTTSIYAISHFRSLPRMSRGRIRGPTEFILEQLMHLVADQSFSPA